jgi:hypothetical protein
MTKHEAIIQALVTALAGHSLPVSREPDSALDPSGALVVAPGDPVEEGRQLGTGTREWMRAVELEHVVTGATEAARAAAIDAALPETFALLDGQTFGGLVDHIDIGGPEDADDVPYDGAETARGAVLVARLYYLTTRNPMETI